MAHKFKNIFKSVTSLIMVLLLILPLVLTSCTKEDAEKIRFNWNMSEEEFNIEANKKLKYVISELFPNLYDQFKDQTVKTVANTSVYAEFTYKLFGYKTDHKLIIKLSPDLKLNAVYGNNAIDHLEQLSKNDVQKIVSELKATASEQGITLTDDQISFHCYNDASDAVARAYVHKELNGETWREQISENIDISLLEIPKNDLDEKKLRKKLDPFVKEAFDLTNLSDYEVYFEDDQLIYKYYLDKYETTEAFIFSYSENMLLDGFNYKKGDPDTPSDYKNIVTKDKLDKTFEKLKEKSDKKITKKDCIINTQDEYLTMYIRKDPDQKQKICTVFELADDKFAGLKKQSYTPDYSKLTQEETELRKIADAKITQKYGITDFSHFDVTIHETPNSHLVTYTLYICGIRADEEFSVSINNKKEVNGLSGNFGEISWILTYTNVEKIQAIIDQCNKIYAEDTGHEIENGDDYIKIVVDGKNVAFKRESIVDTTDPYSEHSDHYHYFQYAELFVYSTLKKTSK